MDIFENTRPTGSVTYGSLLEATRRLVDAVASVSATTESEDVVRTSTANILSTCATLEAHSVDSSLSSAGNRRDLPGRGHPTLPPILIEDESTEHTSGRITFRRAHVAGGIAAHGGTVSLLFDEMLGTLAARGRDRSRTAYLHVNYRRITPIDVELRFEGRIDRSEDRKIFAEGRLLQGSDVLADAEALFVVLRPDQP
ncbi:MULTISPECIES: PaaI family thioesterase [unclassified Rhodococcus (in: high G+C Gram-positive bacteria)]|jgi:acyl-coenzyme A thioesterase PaaI-like protein|uniref:PaaI family thioesterase n=1 Tax=unclassified Rhodococcus (in: high G+C Gram-positive bacteria) TaxID=192944 RepID=UPI00035CF223|nr:PaaI family thioesterase [Rhodococcus sp. DK17]